MSRSHDAVERLLGAMPEDPDAVRRLGIAIHDWPALADAAARHGVMKVVFDGLAQAGVPVPADVARDVARACGMQALSNDLIVHALRRCLHALDGAGIRSVVLKGPLLAERLYGDAAARPSSDIDLLVEDGDVDRARRALEPLGYRSATDAGVEHYRAHHHHITLLHDVLPPVELHFFAHAGFGVKIPARALLDGARTWRCSTGFDACVPAPEDELVFLAVHGARHAFIRLAWLYDLKLLVLAHPQLTATAVLNKARGLGVRRVVGAALHELRRRLRAELPGTAEVRLIDAFTRPALPLLSLELPPEGRPPQVDAALDLVLTSLLCDSPVRLLPNLRGWAAFSRVVGRLLRRPRPGAYGPPDSE